MIGPLYHTDTHTEEAILSQLDSSKKTLLVTMGSGGLTERVSYLNDPYFAKYNIIAVGKDITCLTAPHILKSPFLSLESIFPNVDLVLNQSGSGNIAQALAHGVPIFCYPTFFEQEWNAIRVRNLGYGLYLTGKEPLLEMQQMIEQWVGKKHEPVFRQIRNPNTITESQARFRTVMEELFATHGMHMREALREAS